MSPPNLAFVYLTRNAGHTFDDLAHDIAASTNPGDQVLLVDDGSPGGTGAQVIAFGALHGWGRGVNYDHIITGVPINTDLGCAINLALTRLAENPPNYVVFLQAGSRLDPIRFATARAGLDLTPDVLICPMDQWSADLGCVISLPPQPTLWGMMISWDKFAHLRCVENAPAFGELPLVWQILQGTCAHAPHTIGHRAAPPDADLHLAHALSHLIAAHPDAVPWVDANLSTLTLGALPAARAAFMVAFLPVTTRIVTPPVARGAPLQVMLWGEHRRRIPLSYPHLTPLWSDSAQITEDPTRADLVLVGHPRDVMHENLPASMATAAIISEEPFWDTIFSPDPLARAVTLPSTTGSVRLHQVTHHRSAIFDFDQVPYFLLTEPLYIARYAQMFARNASLDAADWRVAFGARPIDTVFMAERRTEAFHDLKIPAGDITGLCAWRTRLAETVQQGNVQRIGASWTNAPSRFVLDDWHADKLHRLDGQARVISAVENTHQPTYLSEKLFDAFACGARPLYVASPGHRVHDLGLPAGAWVNLWGMDSTQAAAHIDALAWPDRFFVDYAAAQRQLAATFNSKILIETERARLSHAIRAELARLVDLGPA